MVQLDAAALAAFEKSYRLNLVNSLPGFKSANLVGTAAPGSPPNLAVFSSALHLGSNPPTLGIVTRPTTVPRHTYQNIKANGGCFTLNHILAAQAAAAHYTSANFPDDESEFAACGFTEAWRDDFPVPYVAESPVGIGLRLREEHAIFNGTVLPSRAGGGRQLGPRRLPYRAVARALRLRPARAVARAAVGE